MHGFLTETKRSLPFILIHSIEGAEPDWAQSPSISFSFKFWGTAANTNQYQSQFQPSSEAALTPNIDCTTWKWSYNSLRLPGGRYRLTRDVACKTALWRGPSSARSNHCRKSSSSSDSSGASKYSDSESSCWNDFKPCVVFLRLALPTRTNRSGRLSAILMYNEWKNDLTESDSADVAFSWAPNRKSGVDDSAFASLVLPTPSNEAKQ